MERQVAGAVGTASARVMVESVAQEEPLSVDDVLEILDEASQLRGYARALEEKSRSLEQATGELRAANEQLQSLDHLKDDFMSSVTHELRTPLTSIRALSELMLDNPDMEPEQRAEFLGIIVSESERLSRLVNQVLDLAKIEAGAAEWHSTDVDLRALVQDAVRASSELFRERGAAVTLDLPDAVPAAPRRPRPAHPGDAEPPLQRRQVRPARTTAASRSPCAGTATAWWSRSATTAPACPPPSRPPSSRSSARAATR